MSYSVCKHGGKMCDGCMDCYEEPEDLDYEDEEYDDNEDDEEEEEE